MDAEFRDGVSIVVGHLPDLEFDRFPGTHRLAGSILVGRPSMDREFFSCQ